MPIAGRRIVVRRDDVLVVGGLELDGEVLRSIVDPTRRLLWCFVRSDQGDVQPIALDETRVIWLTDGDLVREEMPNDV